MNDTAHHIDRDDLTACVSELLERDLLYPRLRALLPNVDPGGWSEGKQKLKKQPVAPTPWNDAAAGLVTDIHAGAREHETALTLLLFKSARYRGGSDLQTAAALRALPDLIVAAAGRFGRRHAIPADAQRALRSWPRQARAMLDEARHDEETWTKAPGDLRCPYCNRRLQLRPGWDKAREDDVAARSVYCRRCPGSEFRPQSWPPDGWLAVLQHAGGASGARGA